MRLIQFPKEHKNTLMCLRCIIFDNELKFFKFTLNKIYIFNDYIILL